MVVDSAGSGGPWNGKPLWVMVYSEAARRGLKVIRPTTFDTNLSGRKLDQVVTRRLNSVEELFHGLRVQSWTAQGG